VVVVLKVTPTDGKTGRVVLADRLPAGFEVENPHMLDSANTANFPWLKGLGWAEHVEFRDDRFVAALDLNSKANQGGAEGDQAGAAPDGAVVEGEGGGNPPTDGAAPATPTTTIAYVVRAVTPGTYLLPAATIEDMYVPARFARTAAGKLVVEAQK
jgi:alpha-2-macroglobulin